MRSMVRCGLFLVLAIMVSGALPAETIAERMKREKALKARQAVAAQAARNAANAQARARATAQRLQEFQQVLDQCRSLAEQKIRQLGYPNLRILPITLNTFPTLAECYALTGQLYEVYGAFSHARTYDGAKYFAAVRQGVMEVSIQRNRAWDSASYDSSRRRLVVGYNLTSQVMVALQEIPQDVNVTMENCLRWLGNNCPMITAHNCVNDSVKGYSMASWQKIWRAMGRVKSMP